MNERGRKKSVRKPGMNQFGVPLARALVQEVPAYRCSNCGTIMLPTETGDPPVRCSNRKNCGRIFHKEQR